MDWMGMAGEGSCRNTATQNPKTDRPPPSVHPTISPSRNQEEYFLYAAARSHARTHLMMRDNGVLLWDGFLTYADNH